MTGLLSAFALIAVLVGVGYALGRWNVLGDTAGMVLSRLAFFVAIPALLFVTLAQAQVGQLVDPASLVGYGCAVAAVVLYALVSRLVMRRPAGETVVGALCSGYVNAGYLGIPIAVYALGDAAAVVPAMIFQLVILAPAALVTLDVLDARRDGDRKGRAARRTRFLRPLVNPIILGCAAGLVAAALGWHPSDRVLAPIEALAGLAVPCVLLAFGMSLRGSPMPGRSEFRPQLLLATSLKVVAMPALAWALGLAIGVAGHALLVLVLIAALPTAQNVFVYAVRHRAGVTLARESVLVSTVGSIPVLLVIAAVLG